MVEQVRHLRGQRVVVAVLRRDDRLRRLLADLLQNLVQPLLEEVSRVRAFRHLAAPRLDDRVESFQRLAQPRTRRPARRLRAFVRRALHLVDGSRCARRCGTPARRVRRARRARRGRSRPAGRRRAACGRTFRPCATALRASATRTTSRRFRACAAGSPRSCTRASTPPASSRPARLPGRVRARRTAPLPRSSSSHHDPTRAQVILHLRDLELPEVEQRRGEHGARAARRQRLVKMFEPCRRRPRR